VTLQSTVPILISLEFLVTSQDRWEEEKLWCLRNRGWT